jgi:hypothetical protein
MLTRSLQSMMPGCFSDSDGAFHFTLSYLAVFSSTNPGSLRLKEPASNLIALEHHSKIMYNLSLRALADH